MKSRNKTIQALRMKNLAPYPITLRGAKHQIKQWIESGSFKEDNYRY